MLFARWQHHLRFCSGFSYDPLKALVTKISKWSRIQDSFRITLKIESLVVCAIPDIPSKFQKEPSITFWVTLQTDRQTNEVWQKHYLFGGGNKQQVCALAGLPVWPVDSKSVPQYLGPLNYVADLPGRRRPRSAAPTVWQCLRSSWQRSPTNRAFLVVAPRTWSDLAARRCDICRVVVYLPPAS